MFVGHYAVAFAAKRIAPQTSLGTLFFAAQLMDLLWPVFLLAGVEEVRVAPGATKATPLDFVHYPYSHSLLSACVLGLVLGAIYTVAVRRRRGGVVLGALVVSHWVLDALMHRPDLPLWPGGDARVGLGLWNSVALTVVIELGLLVVGLWLYRQARPPSERVGKVSLWVLIATLLVLWLGAIFGPPPPPDAPVVLAVSGLLLWAFVPWGAWADRHRLRLPT